jgi:hypothetical protein
MYAVVFSSIAIVFAVLAIAALAFPWWAVVDVAFRSKESFATTGLSKRAWLILLVAFTIFTYFVGLGRAINYAMKERSSVERLASDRSYGARVGRSAIVLLLVAVSSTVPFDFGRLRDLIISPQIAQVRIEGHLSGQCPSLGLSAEGKKFVVRLTKGRIGKVEGIATMAGHTGRTTFYFDVTPGVYQITATSGTVVRRWGLTFYPSPHSSPQLPVVMNVPVPVVC